MADQYEIDKVLEATDIVGLVSEYVKLEKFGKNYRGLCPFHNEATPSFVVSTEKKIAHCFGCQNGGNAINFLMKIENIDFNEALSKLAQKAGIAITNSFTPKKDQGFTKLYEIMQNTTEFYKNNLLKTETGLKALDYLHKRGLDEETIKVFNIGLAPNGYDSLYQVLHELKYNELDMVDLGLVSRSENGSYFDLFKSRIMFPLRNENGNIMGFSGRIFDSTDKTQAKYYNTKETIIFKKGQNLFNLDLAKGEALKKKRIILHEGQMDVIASYRSGLKEAICTLGTALTQDQVKLIKKYTNHIIVCYDGDKAGINASIKAIKLLRANSFNIHLVKLPDGMDPDEYVLKNGSLAYATYFENNIIDPTTYIYNQALSICNINDINSIEEAKKTIFEELNNCSNSVREAYLSSLAKFLNVSDKSLIMDFSLYSNINEPQNVVDFYDDTINTSKNISSRFELTNIICEFKLIIVAKRSKEQAQEIDQKINPYLSAMSELGGQIWMTLVDEYYGKYEKYDEARFLKLLEPDEVKHYLNGIAQLQRYCDGKDNYTKKDIDDCIKKLKLKQIDIDIKNLEKQSKKTLDLDEKCKLLNQINEKKKIKDKLKNGRK